jgi:predicted Zn-dependent protease with MMP-like domain
MEITDAVFDELISSVMDELPKEYIERLSNVLITYEDDPTPQQREKLKLRCNQSLFGLYEGIPLPARGAGYNFVLPDKITLFKGPLVRNSADMAEFRENTKRTLWHEIAHFYGLDHARIHELENR